MPLVLNVLDAHLSWEKVWLSNEHFFGYVCRLSTVALGNKIAQTNFLSNKRDKPKTPASSTSRGSNSKTDFRKSSSSKEFCKSCSLSDPAQKTVCIWMKGRTVQKKNKKLNISTYMRTRPPLCCSALIEAQTHSQEEEFKALSGTKSKVKGWNNDKELWGRIPLGQDNNGAWWPYNHYLLIINIWIDRLTVCSGHGRRWLDKEENKPHRIESENRELQSTCSRTFCSTPSASGKSITALCGFLFKQPSYVSLPTPSSVVFPAGCASCVSFLLGVNTFRLLSRSSCLSKRQQQTFTAWHVITSANCWSVSAALRLFSTMFKWIDFFFPNNIT